ncbi:ABC transporter ATP-binding protein [Maritimibacter sp. 55A14]|nr:ABC transporter ATP-binding protein [Maritimibacter sp. 55A14]
MAWLWRAYLRPWLPWIGVALALMVVEGASVGALSYMVKPMFDEVFAQGGDRAAAGWIALLVFGSFLARALAGFGQRFIMVTVGQKVAAALQRDMVGHLLTLDGTWFQINPPGSLIERVRGDTLVATKVWSSVLTAFGRDMVALISLLAVAISIDWVWTLIAVAGVPVLLLPIMGLQRWVRRTTRAARVAAAGIATRLDEIFHGVSTIKLNNMEDRDAARFASGLKGFTRAQIRSGAGQAGIPALMDVTAGLGFLGLIVYGGLQIMEGSATIGEFMSFFTAIALVFDPLKRLGNVAGVWQSALASLERIYGIFQERPHVLSPPRPRSLSELEQPADIRLVDVHFAYGDAPVLDGVSFTAKAGQVTALVGASGAGKSTVFNLLTRLGDPQEGRITIGGVDIRELSLGDLRGLFSVVSQEAALFDETIRDNILFGRPEADAAALERALEAAHVSDFLARMPEGLDASAGPRGSNLSGGQRQRVAIARAVLRDAPVLLMDEPTSALDARSEAVVQEALERLAEGRTTLVIAHRLSTVRDADKIVVMDKGRVVDEGTHDELLAREGIYAGLYRLQFAAEDAAS